MLKVWDWRAGRRLYDVAIENAVRPFIAVRRTRCQRGYDSDGERKPPSRRWLARQRRREAKVAAAEGNVGSTPGVEEAEVEGGGEGELEVEGESGDEATDAETPPTGEMEERPVVLVLQKIDTLKVGDRLAVVFNAVGCVFCAGISIVYEMADKHLPPSATALFWFVLPPDPAAAPREPLVVHAHDLGRPVITFTPVTGSLDCLWVSVDANWADRGPSLDTPSHVKMLRLALDSVSRSSQRAD